MAVGARGGGQHSLAPTPTLHRRAAVAALPHPRPQSGLICTPIYRVNSAVLPTGPVLLSAAAGDRLGQVPHLLQVAG